jgi:hypothetical protein
MSGKSWFEVDRAGLARILERRGKQLIIGELLQNVFDEAGATRADLTLTREPGSRDVIVTVEDDAPDGFHDLSHAYTLFAPSKKVDDPEKRGRFNLGDKLVLALAKEARLVSTKGGWSFDEDGRHSVRERRERGTKLTLRIPLTKDEQRACEDFVRRLLPPENVATFYNGVQVPSRQKIGTQNVCLKTEAASADTGALVETYRFTDVNVYAALGGPGDGWLYEMGIPVVATMDGYDVEVMQKVPLNIDRSNVPPSFLRDCRAAALNVTHKLLTPDVANSAWVRNALESSDVTKDAVRSAFTARFTEKAVIYDPSDQEANKKATAAGYVVVHGSQLSQQEWVAVRDSGAALPAGQVTPSRPKATAETERAAMTPALKAMAAAVREISSVLIGRKVYVEFIEAPDATTIADYNRESGTMRFNLPKCPPQWPTNGLDAWTLGVVIHELGHHYSGDHLSEAYYDALTDIGARLAIYAARNPRSIDFAAYLAEQQARADAETASTEELETASDILDRTVAAAAPAARSEDDLPF